MVVSNKVCIAVEKIDESEYWLEVSLSNETIELQRLLDKSIEIAKIMSKAKSSTYPNK